MNKISTPEDALSEVLVPVRMGLSTVRNEQAETLKHELLKMHDTIRRIDRSIDELVLALQQKLQEREVDYKGIHEHIKTCVSVYSLTEYAAADTMQKITKKLHTAAEHQSLLAVPTDPLYEHYTNHTAERYKEYVQCNKLFATVAGTVTHEAARLELEISGYISNYPEDSLNVLLGRLVIIAMGNVGITRHDHIDRLLSFSSDLRAMQMFNEPAHIWIERLCALANRVSASDMYESRLLKVKLKKETIAIDEMLTLTTRAARLHDDLLVAKVKPSDPKTQKELAIYKKNFAAMMSYLPRVICKCTKRRSTTASAEGALDRAAQCHTHRAKFFGERYYVNKKGVELYIILALLQSQVKEDNPAASSLQRYITLLL